MSYSPRSASEFPNDNPLLHRGAIWLCPTPCALPRATLRGPAAAMNVVTEAPPVTESAPPTILVVDAADCVAIASDPEEPLVLEKLVGSPIVAVGTFAVREPTLDAPRAPREDALAAAPERDCPSQPIVSAPGLAPPILVPDMERVDAYTAFVDALVGSTLSFGATRAAAALRQAFEAVDSGRMPSESGELLTSAGLGDRTSLAPAFVARARAWRDILSGTSDDFEIVGDATLDGWAAELVGAVLLEASSPPDSVRRSLRERGVAAFGMLVAA